MDKLVIKGGEKLHGCVKVSGAKNSALVLMPAALLNAGENELTNIPEVNDIYTMSKLLKHLGAEISFENHTLKINTKNISETTAPYEHVKKMRASVYVLGPLLARYGRAKVSLPGGCAWGPRPINLHLDAMKKLGANIEFTDGYIIATASQLRGAKINFEKSSVGATGNTLMASVLAKGTTFLTNAAIEPEITLLCDYLNLMGARIEGIGTNSLTIDGVDELKPADTDNIQDRIEAGTLLIAAAMTQGNVEIEYNYPNHLNSVIWKLEDSGLNIIRNNGLVKVDASNFTPKNINLSTAVFPGFPTDMQAQWTAFMTLAEGESVVTDNIYFDRFKHVPELNRLGADIRIINNSALVSGGKKLKGAKVMSTDLRASASLVLSGLAAEGETEVLRIYHLDRGYQRIEEKLQSLGADIERISTVEY